MSTAKSGETLEQHDLDKGSGVDEGSGDFEESFADLYALAFRTAYRVLGRWAEAEDVAQETLARAYRRWPAVAQRSRQWVATVSANLALDHARWERRRSLGWLTRVAPPAGPGADELASERAALRDALRHLPRRQREVVVMRYLAELSEAEVAIALGCSAGTVKTHASRGLTSLRAVMGVGEGEVADVRTV